jgi:hypothetical protein
VIDKLTTCLSIRHSNPFDQRLVAPSCIVERGFELGGWDVAEVAVQTAGVVPVRLVDAIEHRNRHVDARRLVAAARWLKPLLATISQNAR